MSLSWFFILTSSFVCLLCAVASCIPLAQRSFLFPLHGLKLNLIMFSADIADGFYKAGVKFPCLVLPIKPSDFSSKGFCPAGLCQNTTSVKCVFTACIFNLYGSRYGGAFHHSQTPEAPFNRIDGAFRSALSDNGSSFSPKTELLREIKYPIGSRSRFQ